MKLTILIGILALGSTPSTITEQKITPNVHYDKIAQHSLNNIKTETVRPLNITEKNFKCLAKNIYYEAGVENWHGKIAVAQVTLHRKLLGKWGKSMCDVVYAKNQFSWTLDKTKANTVPKGPLWEASKKAARDFVEGIRLREFFADHYHGDYITKPKWAKSMERHTKIGKHIFYVAYNKESK